MTYKENDTLYILQKLFPHYIGRIQYQPEPNPFIQGQIPFYHIYIVFNGTLSGNKILLTDAWQHQLTTIWNEMCQWYREERIEKSPARFKKYKI